jgi:hypothetical protein
MTQSSHGKIPTDKFLLIAMNLLHRDFIAATRTDAKQRFKEIVAGRTVDITNVQMEDKSTVQFSLALDHSEYRGRLNFGAFKAGLTALLGNISLTLQDGSDVAVFKPEQQPDSVLFGITGVTMEDSMPRILVLGADAGARGPAVTLRLMYLDHQQFIDGDAATG